MNEIKNVLGFYILLITVLFISVNISYGQAESSKNGYISHTSTPINQDFLVASDNNSKLQTQQPTKQKRPKARQLTTNDIHRQNAKRASSARRMENRGNLESALKIWEQLYEANPTDQTYFDSIIRVLSNMGRLEEAISLLEQQITANTGNNRTSSLYARLGSVYYMSRETGKAEIAWEQAIQYSSGSPQGYLALSQAFLQLRLTERAVKVLFDGREKLNDPYLFTNNLAPLLQSRMDWSGAAQEYILSLEKNAKRKSYVIRSLSNFPNDSTANRAVQQTVENALTIFEETEPWEGYKVSLWEILVEQKMKNGDYDGAVKLLENLVKEEKHPWQRLVQFAMEAHSEGAVEASQQALELAREHSKSLQEKAEVDLAIASLLESRGLYQQADSIFSMYCNENRLKTIEARARFSRGLLRLERLDSPEMALDDFNFLLEKTEYKNNPGVHYSKGVALARLGLFDDALKELGVVLKRKAPQKQRQRKDLFLPSEIQKSLAADAALLAARIHWWQGDTNKAAGLLDSMLTRPTGENAENDAFSLYKMIKDGISDSLSLERLGKADHDVFCKNFNSADSIYRKLAQDTSLALGAEAAWRLVLMELNYNDSVDPDSSATPEGLELFVTQYPDHPRAEEVWLELGAWWERSGNPDEALICYETILIQYPEGLLGAEARLRLDLLSGVELPLLAPDPMLEEW